MPPPSRSALKVHACAFNARDMDCLVAQYTGAARLIRDGAWAGEGREAVRKALLSEPGFGHVLWLDDEPVIVTCTGEEGHERPSAVLHVQADRTGGFTECRISHDPVELAHVRNPC